MSVNRTSGALAPLNRTSGASVVLSTTDGRIIAGEDTSGSAPTIQRTDPATLTSPLRNVVTGAYKSPFTVDADAALGSTTFHTMKAMHPAIGIRAYLAGGNTGVRAGLSIRGVVYELTVNGSPVFDIPAGDSGPGILTDPLPDGVFIEAGDDLGLRRYTPAGQKVYVSKSLGTGSVVAGAHHLRVQVPPANAAGQSNAPLAVVGKTLPTARAIFLDGDSMMVPDWARMPATEMGYAWTDRAQFGAQVDSFDAYSSGKFTTSPWTHFLFEYGTNHGGLAQPGQYNKAIAAMYLLADKGIKGAQTTLAPRTGSTDSYATVESQTPGSSPEWREAWNAWVRDGSPLDTTTRTYVAPGASGANVKRAGEVGHCLAFPPCDVASALEVPYPANTALHVWKAGKLTSDGTHYTQAGNAVAREYTREWMSKYLAY